jgi:hypothetical protein
MSELNNNAFGHDGRLTGIASRARNPATRFDRQADLMLTRYSVEEREQIAELLRILAAKPGDAEKGAL